MKAFCKRCLLRDMDEEEILRSVNRLVEDILEEDRVPQKVYQERLAACEGCEQLYRGMCRLCGCYVELRTALRVRRCPMVPPKWERMPSAEE
ncbi:MAG: hypothetical protein IIZ39_04210 [Blautia sp.]|nr:hypothetical protein [Blautia sp.]